MTNKNWDSCEPDTTFATKTFIDPPDAMDSEQPLLSRSATVPGMADNRGRPASRTTTGGWRSAFFIIGVEIAERFAFCGMSANLIMYLTGTLAESTATAAVNIDVWSGVAAMMPLLGGLLADSWLGRYRTIILASLLYILSMIMLTLSATVPPLRPTCSSDGCSPSTFQVSFFFCSIYLVSIALGGQKPCMQAFGTDQFDNSDPIECASKSSFFNWWFFGVCVGTAVSAMASSYVQDNISWGLGFGIPTISVMFSLVIFVAGRRTYRYHIHAPLRQEPKEPIAHGDAVSVMKLFPIWSTSLIFGIVFAQATAFFTKQASTMDRHIGDTFLLPSASLYSIIPYTIVCLIPLYDRVFVPMARMFTGLPSGITVLWRIGVGMFISTISMVVASLVERRRLGVARDHGLIDDGLAVVPMSFWWLVPQYVLFGMADVFTIVGLQEFFNNQVPIRFRSLGTALYLSVMGVGSILSGSLISIIDKASRRSGESWFADNLNRGHLDYFYLLLAGLSLIQLLVYLRVSRAYIYKEPTN